MKPSLQTIVDALQIAWGADTAYDPNDWSDKNRARGQCVVSSLIIQDYLGGELLRYSVDEGTLHETHYMNRLSSGVVIDTTGSQYDHPVTMRIKPIQLDGFKSIRDKRLADTATRKRYEILKARVDHLLAKQQV